MRPLSIIYLYQNCGLYLRAACINYFSYYLRFVFEGGLYLKAASIRENTVTPNMDTFYDLRKTIDIVRFVLTSLLYMHSLREKCPKMEFFWSVFSCIRTEYGEIRSISPYSVRMWENRDQKKLRI